VKDDWSFVMVATELLCLVLSHFLLAQRFRARSNTVFDNFLVPYFDIQGKTEKVQVSPPPFFGDQWHILAFTLYDCSSAEICAF